MILNVLDLFSGIGGFSLGLERAGMTTVAFCEIEPYPRSILKKHWPDVPIYKDVRALTAKQLKKDGINDIGLICGGYPCQPFSVAGQRRGEKDDRHLWPEVLRLLQEIRPPWALFENVAGHISMGLDEVLSDLEGESYACQTVIIPACAVNAPHRRDRVWIIAHADSQGEPSGAEHDRQSAASNSKRFRHRGRGMDKNSEMGRRSRSQDKCKNGHQIRGEIKPCDERSISNTKHPRRHSAPEQGGDRKTVRRSTQRKNSAGQSEGVCASASMANASRTRREECDMPAQPGWAGYDTGAFSGFRPIGAITEPALCHRDDGISQRVARLKALGNAVVPQIPEIIGRAIMAAI